MKGVVICALVVLAMAQSMVKPGQAAITCADVASGLAQCVSYLTGEDAKPLGPCCEGVKRVKALLITTEDKRTACKCIKDAASHIHNIKDSAVSSLPADCNCPLPFAISTSFDCNSIP